MLSSFIIIRGKSSSKLGAILKLDILVDLQQSLATSVESNEHIAISFRLGS